MEVSAASLKQLLEMYRRSGLRWYLMPDGTKVNVRHLLQRFERNQPSNTATLADNTSTNTSSAPSQSTKIAPATQSPTKPESSTKHEHPAKPQHTAEDATPTAAPLSQPSRVKETKPPTIAPAPQYSTWQLPLLTLDQREQNFAELRKRVAACMKCNELVNYRTQTVLGDGTLQPKVCFFGEAPGADEDKQGVPFVGKAGQLLDKIIEATTLKRPDDVYILNSLRCRPPSNRTPTPEEVENCRPFFELQLEVLQPKYIVCLGAVAVRAILQRSESVGMLRGKFHAYRGAKVLVTYHPAYLLRNPDAKKLVWEDMQLLMAEMGLRRKGG
jgi:DNA polymerase